MTTPEPYPGERREIDYYHLPLPGDYVRIKGLVSTTYLRRDETMVIRWTDWWAGQVERNYIDVQATIEEPSASELFPTVNAVWQMIERGATTLPGEHILGIRASEAELIVRVGVSAQYSREFAVAWPDLQEVINVSAQLRDSTRELSENAIEALEDGVVELKVRLVDYNGIASAAAEVALTAAENAAQAAGESGLSAFQIAAMHGFEGSESDWLQSLKGDRGAQGDVGPRGIQGIQGERGPQGLRGPQGEQGVQGEQGDAGADGRSVTITGTVSNAASLPASGELGEGYVTNTDGHLHVWGGSSWADVGPVRGPQGLRGPQGEAGPAGEDGVDGAQGIQGEVGPQGEQGAPGDRGPQGIQGERGERGFDGLTGERGPQGLRGEAGPQGEQGEAGTTDFTALDNVPDEFPAAQHTHPVNEVTGLSGQLSAITTALGGFSFRKVEALPASPDPQIVYFVKE